MRRIMMFNRVTPEGYFAAPDGSLDWVVPDDELDKAGASASPEADTILFGRRTYEQFASFWPHALDESPTAPDPHAARRRSPAIRAMGTFINEANKLVFSKSLKEVSWKGSRILREVDPAAIEAMKKQPGKDMLLLGSGSIVSQLTQHGLIDEYQFVVTPLLLGRGRSLFGDVSKRSRLELVEAKRYASGNVVLRYVRAQ